MAGINSKLLLLSIGISVIIISSLVALFAFEEKSNTLTDEEINKLEQSQKSQNYFIDITNDNPEFFEKWCIEQNGKWDAHVSQIGGFCNFDSKLQKDLAMIGWDKLQHPIVQGEMAQKICNILDLECPTDPKFDGWFDDETGYVKLTYAIQDREFSFRILEDSLEYSRNGFYDNWYSYEDTFGQNLSFELDDDFYFSGDVIQVSGFVWKHAIKNPEVPVTLQVFFDGDLVEIAQTPASSDGAFSYQIKTAGPQWQQSGVYTVAAFYDSGKSEKDFGFSTYYNGKQTKYFTKMYSNNYEELCGYPVTQEMQKTFLESWKSRPDDKDSFLTIRQGVFSHVERSQYLTAIPILHYWYDLKDGKQTYFGMEACSLDKILFRAEPGPNYEKPKDIVIDGVTYVELEAPGKPLIYKNTLLPLLNIDNCKKVADVSTEQQRQKIFTRENTDPDIPWANQIFQLMDYCNEIGNYEMNVVDGKIKWIFTV
ncbi:MAG: hypothetical protein ACE5RC_06940 [Nitrosopumilus sp.]